MVTLFIVALLLPITIVLWLVIKWDVITLTKKSLLIEEYVGVVK